MLTFYHVEASSFFEVKALDRPQYQGCMIFALRYNLKTGEMSGQKKKKKETTTELFSTKITYLSKMFRKYCDMPWHAKTVPLKCLRFNFAGGNISFKCLDSIVFLIARPVPTGFMADELLFDELH